MPLSSSGEAFALKTLGIDRVSYDRMKQSFENDLDLMGVYDFVLLIIKNFSLNKKDKALQLVENTGLKVVASERHVFDRMDAVKLAIIRAQAKGTPLDVQEHAATLESLLQGPSEAVIVAGRDANSKLLELVGPENPQMARRTHPQSLRAQFGGNSLTENGFHCSVQRSEAHEELSLLFPNYIDLLKAKGYASQVDQWLWTLWRSQPHKAVIKTSLLDISRYHGKDADHYADFRQVIRYLLYYIWHKLTAAFGYVFSTGQHPVEPAASVSGSTLSSAEEEDMARAILAEELGMTNIPAFREQRPASSLEQEVLRKRYLSEVPSSNRELEGSLKERMLRNSRPEKERRPSTSQFSTPRQYRSNIHRGQPLAPMTFDFDTSSAMDMYGHESTSSLSPHADRVMKREAEKITDELLDLHGVSELME